MYEPTKWQNHATEPQNRFKIKQIEGDEYEIVPCGDIVSRGTLLSAGNFNKIERGISETVTALGCLLQIVLLNRDKSLADHMYITEERTLSIDGFNTTEKYVMQGVFFRFDEARKSAEYIAIPIITNVEIFTEQDEGYTPTYEVSVPVLTVADKTTTGFSCRAYCGDRESDFKAMTFRFLIIGGISNE